MPLYKGVNEAPTGLANGWVESEADGLDCGWGKVVPPGEIVVAEPGLSNCWN
jgi:hypothetical protein